MKNKFIVFAITISMLFSAVSPVIAADTANEAIQSAGVSDSVSESEMIDKMLEKEVVTNKADGLFHSEEEIKFEERKHLIYRCGCWKRLLFCVLDKSNENENINN